MPHEYNVPQLMRFPSSYEHVGLLLRTFYQPYACEIMDELIKNNELNVKEIRGKLGKNVQNFIVSKTLTSLKKRGIVQKTGNLYILLNSHFYESLRETTIEIKKSIGVKSKKIDANDVRSVAEFFTHVFFDITSNSLFHILLKRALNFNNIVETFRSNHGYVARAKIRYHLVTRKIIICGSEVEIFKMSSKKYHITRVARQLHHLFDSFIVEYETGIEDWVKNVFHVIYFLHEFI